MRYRLAFVFALVLLAACSGGGSSDADPVPVLPWGSFRHDATNSGVGSGVLRNTGTVTLLTDAATLGGVTASTPAIDSSGRIYVGTGDGLVSLHADGDVRWRVDGCLPTTGTEVIPIGTVSSSPSLSPGDDILFGDEGSGGQQGAFFALQQDGGDLVACLWAFRPTDASARFTVRSSSVAQVDPNDLSLVSAFTGDGDGRILAVNGDGTPRWSFPTGSPGGAAITSTPAFSTNGILYGTTADGLLNAIDFSGRVMWQFPVGVPPPQVGVDEANRLQPSPAVATTVYAVGSGGALFGVNPDSTLKWQYSPRAPISGSPAYLGQSFDQGSENVFDTIIYVVDVEGNIYGVSDIDGTTFQVQRCSLAETTSCRMDSCVPNEGTCDPGTRRCSETNVDCTVDTCLPDNGQCMARDGIVQIAGGSTAVQTSPAVSADFFVLVGTADGRLCASSLDGNVPGDQNDEENPNPWANGCVTLGSRRPVRSSPVIGRQNTIYITTDEGLFAIQ